MEARNNMEARKNPIMAAAKPGGARIKISHTNFFDEPDPGLQALRERLTKALELAAGKAVAHLADPKKYPLSQTHGSLERALGDFIGNLPTRKRKEAIEMLLPTATGTASDRERAYGQLAAVNLRSAIPVIAQAQSLRLPRVPSPSERLISKVRRLALDQDGRPPEGDEDGRPGGDDRPPLHKLQLRLRSLECLKDTKELFKDEIRLMGTASDGIGVVKNIKPVKLGKFKTGKIESFNPPQVFATFDTQNISLLPRSFDVALILFEKDWGKSEPGQVIDSAVDGIVDFVKDDVTEYVKKLILEGGAGSLTAAVVAFLTNPELGVILAGAAIGFLVAIGLGVLGSLLKKILSDEVFDPARANITLESLTGLLDEDFITNQQLATYSGFGATYKLNYDWRLIP